MAAIRRFLLPSPVAAVGRFQPVRSSLRFSISRPQVFQLVNPRLQLVVNDARSDAVEKERKLGRVCCRNLALSCLSPTLRYAEPLR